MTLSHRLSLCVMPLMWAVLFIGCSTKSAQLPYKFLHHDLKIQLEPAVHKLFAVDTITVQYPRKTTELHFFLHNALRVERVNAGNQELAFSSFETYDLSRFSGYVDQELNDAYKNARLYRVDLPPQLEPERVEVRYQGAVYDTLKSASFSRMMVADQSTGLIGEEGAFLSSESFWYPSLPKSLSSFRLTAMSPAGYAVLSSGKLVQQEQSGDSLFCVWEEKKPIDALYLSAANYQVQKIDQDGVELSTWFLPQSQTLSQAYLQACQGYLKMYNEMLGKYPYAKFSVVENFFPTGYGMPSFTLLGSEVIRLPFMTQISLGHEICHNWWGNGVFVDMRQGNWCEGLTTYCADYHYKELESLEAARQYRYEVLKDYSSYVTHDTLDFPLVDFRERTTPASRVIGYGKSMMVFHQIRKIIGDEAFYQALRNVYADKLSQFAGWIDFRRAFEASSQLSLEWFFDQWIDRKGAARLELQEPIVRQEGGEYKLSAKILQEVPLFRLYVPVKITTVSGVVDTLMNLRDQSNEFVFSSSSPIEKISVDPDFDVFRHLDPQEISPSISQFFGADKQLIVLPSNADENIKAAYSDFAKTINRNGEAQVVSDQELNSLMLNDYSVMVLGSGDENAALSALSPHLPDGVSENQGIIRIFDHAFDNPQDFTLLVLGRADQPQKPILWLQGRSPSAVSAVARKIVHYGKYGYLGFREGTNVLKGNWEVTSSPLSYTFD